jgi:hypothetical protein
MATGTEPANKIKAPRISSRTRVCDIFELLSHREPQIVLENEEQEVNRGQQAAGRARDGTAASATQAARRNAPRGAHWPEAKPKIPPYQPTANCSH